ncbi:recombinase family protein [Kiloniella sp.]|uniref:recombinase family protein n=1 Tax=Kiloniella sp. TaxID=1938587 RepID=UPI003B027686
MSRESTASGEFVFNIFSALAQFERRLIQERTRAEYSLTRFSVPLLPRPQVCFNPLSYLD